jgi:hypothetical protein
MAISVTEKEHIKELIEKRINAEIERISTENKSDADDIRTQARKQAITALGLTQAIEDLESIDQQIAKLNDKRAKVEQKTLESLNIDMNRNYNRNSRQAIDSKIASASVSYEKALVEAHPKLKQINALKDERDNLLQTIWIATSNSQVKALFDYLNDLLDTKPTAFEVMAQKIAPDQTM